MLSKRDQKIRRWFELQSVWKNLTEESTRFLSKKEIVKFPKTFESVGNIFEDIIDEQKKLALEIWPSGIFD